MEFESISFVEPLKAINSPQDLKAFQNSSTYKEFFNFIQLAGESIKGYEFSPRSIDIDSSSEVYL